jgi:hypothetical protein
MFRYRVVLLALILLAGCHSEKSDIVAYLKELEASNHRLELISRDYQEVVSVVSEESVAGKIEREDASEKLRLVADQLKREIAQVEALQVPEKAQGLHRAVLAQYQVLLETVESTEPMVQLLAQLNEANRVAADAPGEAARITQEMKAVEARRGEIASRLDELIKEGRQYEEQARKEQRELQQEFGIAVKMEKP